MSYLHLAEVKLQETSLLLLTRSSRIWYVSYKAGAKNAHRKREINIKKHFL